MKSISTTLITDVPVLEWMLLHMKPEGKMKLATKDNIRTIKMCMMAKDNLVVISYFNITYILVLHAFAGIKLVILSRQQSHALVSINHFTKCPKQEFWHLKESNLPHIISSKHCWLPKYWCILSHQMKWNYCKTQNTKSSPL